MGFQIPAKVTAVFGSRTRAKVLGYLAESSTPRTGYAISRTLEIGVSKVYGELKRLESCGILASSLDAKGSKGFLLKDEDLRNFLRRNLRILPADEWFSLERTAERRKRFGDVKRIAVDLPSVPARAGKRPFAIEFRRPAGKDRALDRIKKTSGRRR